jgi:hypothetical protein
MIRGICHVGRSLIMGGLLYFKHLQIIITQKISNSVTADTAIVEEV